MSSAVLLARARPLTLMAHGGAPAIRGHLEVGSAIHANPDKTRSGRAACSAARGRPTVAVRAAKRWVMSRSGTRRMAFPLTQLSPVLRIAPTNLVT